MEITERDVDRYYLIKTFGTVLLVKGMECGEQGVSVGDDIGGAPGAARLGFEEGPNSSVLHQRLIEYLLHCTRRTFEVLIIVRYSNSIAGESGRRRRHFLRILFSYTQNRRPLILLTDDPEEKLAMGGHLREHRTL